MHHVYILQDDRKKLYVGYSNNLKRRITEHRYKGVVTTQSYNDPQLVWYCGFKDKRRALEFEKYLKAGSGYAFVRKHLIE